MPIIRHTLGQVSGGPVFQKSGMLKRSRNLSMLSGTLVYDAN